MSAQCVSFNVVLGCGTAELSQIKSTLIHEDVHVQQIAEGRLGNEGTFGGVVSELEARYVELQGDSTAKSGIGPEIQARIIGECNQMVHDLSVMAPAYHRQVVIEQNFTPTYRHTNRTPVPAWIKGQ